MQVLASKFFGILLIIIAIIIAILYVYGLIIDPDKIIYGVKLSELLIKITILVVMLTVACIIGYIGYLITSTPKPKSIEEIIEEYQEMRKSKKRE